MIDLRSDTLTCPTPGMREAIANAEVGDDVYAEDPAVNELQYRVAALFGKEAGLFTTTGSLSNLLGIYCLVNPGEEVVCDVQAHIARAELGAHAALHGVTMRTWQSSNGVVDAETVANIIAPDGGTHLVSTKAVEIENTHNFGGGTIQPYENLVSISKLCHEVGIKLHLDGARIWNAHVATGIPLTDYGELFDTISVCFSKGLGAPVGSMLLSSAENITKARAQRKRLGGGWRQSGVLAAAADYALTHQLARLEEDHAAAVALATEVAATAPEAVDAGGVETNIVVINTGEKLAAEVTKAAKERDVLLSQVGPRIVRAVTHLGVTSAQSQQAGQIIAEILAK